MVNDEPNSRGVSISLEKPSAPARAELEAARSGSIVALLPQVTVLEFSGGDAESFLQGQLTCDVAALRNTAGYGAWCSPQGRMLASFLLWRHDTGIFMALRADIAPGVQQRIARYVLRAKVAIAPAPLALLGVAGPDADAALRRRGAVPPAALGTTSPADGGAVIRLDDSRFLLAATQDRAQALLAELRARLTPVSGLAWDWLDLRRGIPWITAPTQDRLVPQMANLEHLGGVSFTKGCYTGQEIVARAQHRGTVKRRMFLANVAAECAAGDELFAEDLGDQAAGMIVNAAASPDGGTDALAVVNSASREASVVHLRSLDGPALRFLPDTAP
jgi:tRNA-modifying protein YgfZ